MPDEKEIDAPHVLYTMVVSYTAEIALATTTQEYSSLARAVAAESSFRKGTDALLNGRQGWHQYEVETWIVPK